MTEEFTEKELERLATAMLMYLFSYEKKDWTCNGVFICLQSLASIYILVSQL